MNQDDKSTVQKAPRADSLPQSPEEVDQFFTKLQSDMRRPDLSQDAITEAFNSIQRLAQDGEPGHPAHAPTAGTACSACGTPNDHGGNFCVSCGAPLHQAPGENANAPGRHHYHHHYHHHDFSGAPGGFSFPVPSTGVPVPSTASNVATRVRNAGPSQPMSRAEISLRKISQDWAFACNTKHLDDLVGLYAADAIVMRPNVPPIRGLGAIREFLFAALDTGLGEIEFEPLRVELFGDIGYEVGRCKMLVPSSTGKRREERGKYLMISHKQEGEWKAIADSWSIDLSLSPAVDPGAKPGVPPTIPPRPPRK
jgi:ketosteroid isomerase-like protein